MTISFPVEAPWRWLNARALHLAADQGYRHIIHLLVDKGAEVRFVGQLGCIPLPRILPIWGMGSWQP